MTTTTAASPEPGPNGKKTDATATLFLRRRFKAPRTALYRAFVNPEALALWWGPRGCVGCDVAMDLRPGGAWRACMQNDDGRKHCVGGVYREIVDNERLVFTWIWEGGDFADIETLVSLVFKDAADGSELILTQTELSSERARELHEQGWSSSLECLDETLSTEGTEA